MPGVPPMDWRKIFVLNFALLYLTRCTDHKYDIFIKDYFENKKMIQDFSHRTSIANNVFFRPSVILNFSLEYSNQSSIGQFLILYLYLEEYSYHSIHSRAQFWTIYNS